MKLYTHIDRVYRELEALGKPPDALLDPVDLCGFDQLHYHGIDAVQYAVDALGLDAQSRVLEIGSGLGGPSRCIAKAAGCNVTALELQPDQNAVALELTARCGLGDLVDHQSGDIMEFDGAGKSFDAIASWLAIYHIPDRSRLLEICYGLLSEDGLFYTEDLFCRAMMSPAEKEIMASGLYAAHLPDFETYLQEFAKAGFEVIEAQDMSEDWTGSTCSRLQQYRQSRERHIQVHNAITFESMEEFYTLVSGLFGSGKLGGIRLIARKRQD